MNWQDMRYAPTDGRQILVHDGVQVGVARWVKTYHTEEKDLGNDTFKRVRVEDGYWEYSTELHPQGWMDVLALPVYERTP